MASIGFAMRRSFFLKSDFRNRLVSVSISNESRKNIGSISISNLESRSRQFHSRNVNEDAPKVLITGKNRF